MPRGADRRWFLRVSAAVALAGWAALATASSRAAAKSPAPRFDVVEKTIPELQEARRSGRVTSRELVALYLERIALSEDRLHAALAVNPQALAEAEALDRERAAGHVRGPLHGIPIALKDNIQTLEMPTTAGALVFDGFVPPYEATLVANLRPAGAGILA